MAINPKNKIAVMAGIAATIMLAFLVALSIPSFASISDLPQYYAAANLLLHGQGASIWLLDDMSLVQHQFFPALAERVIPSYLPPVAIIYLIPLLLAPLKWLPVLWPCLLAIAVACAVVVLKQCFVLTNKQLLWIWAVVCLSGPMFESIRIGQLAPFLLLAFSLVLREIKADRPWLAALYLSVLLLKPQELLPFVVYLIGCRRYKFVACLAAVAALLFALSLVVIGFNGWQNYFLLLSNSITNSVWMQPELCPTVRGQLLRLPLATNAGNVIAIFALVLALAAIFIGGIKSAKMPDWLERGLVLSLPLGFVFALHLHDYDLLLLIPSAVAIIKMKLIDRLPSWLVLLSMFAFLSFLLPFYVYVHYDYLLKGGMINPLFCLLLFASLGLFLVTGGKQVAAKS